jgi:hypothetical protein
MSSAAPAPAPTAVPGNDAARHNDARDRKGEETGFKHALRETKDILIAGGFALVYGVAAVTLPDWTTPWWLFGGTAVLA